MTMTKQQRLHIFQCDKCSAYTTLPDSSLHVIRKKLAIQGWSYEEVGGKYLHYCPKCAKPHKHPYAGRVKR